MAIKVIGVILVLCGSSGLGWYMADRGRQHIQLLEELRKKLMLLKGEIVYGNSPLGEACARVAAKSEGEFSSFFDAVSKRIEAQRGEPLYEIWKEETGKLDRNLPLSAEDKQQLEQFGEHLGYLNTEMQERTILLYLEQLEESITYLKEHQREKSRLYTSLGILGGVFLVIILC